MCNEICGLILSGTRNMIAGRGRRWDSLVAHLVDQTHSKRSPTWKYSRIWRWRSIKLVRVINHWGYDGEMILFIAVVIILFGTIFMPVFYMLLLPPPHAWVIDSSGLLSVIWEQDFEQPCFHFSGFPCVIVSSLLSHCLYLLFECIYWQGLAPSTADVHWSEHGMYLE